ncbi:MAG: carboxyl transferase domain-containing protein [Myxococcota bacterium]|nr:carboxyl transferase domain-containing protein [Myxococcota bacterium]
MVRITSELMPNSADFLSRQAVMLEMVNEFREAEAMIYNTEEKAREKFIRREKLLPRERIFRLLDPGSPFLELMSLAGRKMHDDRDGSYAGGGLIAGIGYVEGKRVLVSANNSAIKGGTINPAGLNKSLRLLSIARENKLPIISLAESGGANLNYATDIFIDGARTFANQARMSAAGIPQVTVVFGNATAGGAYQPALADYTIMVRKKAKMFLAGPPLVLAAIGEETDEQSLGGAELHCEEVGTGDYLAEDDVDGIRLARQVLKDLNWRIFAPIPNQYEQPCYSQEDLLGIVPTDSKIPYDAREIIARITDGSEFSEFKADYDHQTLCGFAQIMGFSCGVLANNGPINPEGAAKATQFIQLCDQVGTPLVFLQNTTGFMVGTRSEKGGVIKQGAKMIQAVANARVPKITILIGGSYGAGNYAMCGRGLDPRFIFTWPNSKTAVMGGEQAGKVLRIVAEQKHANVGLTPDPAMLDALEQSTADKINEESTALFGTAHLWDDGIIDPRDTRKVLGFTLSITLEGDSRPVETNTFGIGRQ